MAILQKIIITALLMAAALLAAWSWLHRYGADKWQAGYDAAVAAGKAQYDRDAAKARQTETDLRAELRAKDDEAYRKEQAHADALDAAQRRLRAGDDRLRCPVAVPVPAAPEAGDRSPPPGSAGDGAGPAIVPETAAEILGDGAAVAGLVRRLERAGERFDACHALNAQ